MKKLALALGLVALIVVFVFVLGKTGNDVPKYRTEKVERGALTTAVTATGTVNAVITVQVGTQVSGTIKELRADFNSRVKKGELIARIDPAAFEAQVEQARANVLAAREQVRRAEASRLEAERAFERNGRLFDKGYLPRSELDSAETGLSSASAQKASAEAQVRQAEASLRLAETNLRYTRILSPVDGIVISRSVDVGQTVAASFQTPTLFTIAQDLTQMQINTSVDEADIGKVREGQEVEFTVDAYPDTIFSGQVSQIRLAAVTVQNVVTYDVVIRVDNPEMKLKPGMTTNVSVIVARKEDALKIPNAAIRFRPTEKEVPQKGLKGYGIWTLEKGELRRIPVKVGISDGTDTEILEGEVREGMDVVVESLEKPKNQGSASSPLRFRP